MFTKLSLKKKNSSEKDFFLPQDQRKIASIIHQEQTLEEKYQGLDKKLYLIQKSTKTLIPAFCLLHHKLRQKFKWYYNWHLRPACSKIHLGVLALYTAGVIFASALALLSPPIKETIAQPQQAKQELADKRTEFTKTFQNSDGSFTVEATLGPSHYKDNPTDPNEPWKEIDTTIETQDGKQIVSKVPYFQAEILANPGYRIERKDGQGFVQEELLDSSGNPIQAQGETQGNKKIYKDVFPETDFVVEATAGGMKGNVILKGPNAPKEFQFKLTSDKEPEPEKKEGKFKDKEKLSKVKFNKLITQAFVVEQADIPVTLTYNQNILTVALENLPQDTTYPLTIDPVTIPEEQVSASTDDARNAGATHPGDGNYSATATTDSIGSSTANFFILGARFQTLPIPQGTTINSASLSLMANAATSISTNINIHGEAADNASTFAATTHEPYDSYVAKTTAVANWNIGTTAWTAGTYYASSNISTVVQEIVSRAGWVYNNALVLVVTNVGTSLPGSDNSRVIRQYNYSGNVSGPKLNITYTPVAGTGTKIWDGGGGADTNWSTALNWSGDTIPTSSDVVFFNATSINNSTVNSGFTNTIKGLVIESGYTGTITLANNLTISNDVDLEGGTLNASSYTINVGGNWQRTAGTFTYGTSTVNLTGTGNLTLNISHNFYNLSVAYSGKITTVLYTGTGYPYVYGVFTLNGGTFTGNYTILRASSGTPLVFAAPTTMVGSLYYYPSSADATVNVAGGNYGNTQIDLYAATNNVTFNLAGDLTMSGGFAALALESNTGTTGMTFNTQNYSITTPRIWFRSGNTFVNAYGPVTFNAGSSTITLSGSTGLSIDANAGSKTLNLQTSTWNNAGSWTLVNGTGTITVGPGTSSVNFTATATGRTITSNNQSFYNLTFNGSGGGWTLRDNMAVSGNFTFTNGTLSAGSSTVTFNATSSGKFIKTNGQAFNSITFDGIGGEWTLQDNLSVVNNLTLANGTFNAGATTLTVGGNWNRTGGTFNAGTSTVNFNATSTGKTITSGGQSFNNLIFNSQGKALSFDGVNDYVSVGSSSNFNMTQGTIEFWVKRYDVGNTAYDDPFYIYQAKTSDYLLIRIDATTRKLGLIIEDNDAVILNVQSSDTFSTANQWYHVTVAQNGTNASIYINGVNQTLSGTNNGSWTSHLTSWNTWIGNSNWQPINGTIDEVRIYNRALSPDEITAHYNAGAGQYGQPESGLVGGWHLDEGTGITASDYSGNGNIGTLLPTGSEPTWAGGKILQTETQGSWTLQDNLDINGNLTIANGALNASNKTINVAGNWTRTGGTFNADTSTITLDGSDQTISGSTTFNNLTKTTTMARTLTFSAGSTQTVAGTLTLQGASGQLLSLYSSSSGTQWNLNLQGSASVNYLDVKDSNLSGTSIYPPNSTNSGNNSSNWLFPDHYTLTGTSKQNPGDFQTVTIVLKISSGTTLTQYSGDKTLTFSGANSVDSYKPTTTDKSNTAKNFGDSLTLSFSNGQATTTMVLYKAESVSIDVTDGTISSTADASYDLDVIVASHSAGTITIDNGAEWSTQNVTLTPAASGAKSMKISNNSDFSSSDYEAFSTSKSWTLSSGDGEKTVYVKFKDTYGNETDSSSDKVKMDTTPPSQPEKVLMYDGSDRAAGLYAVFLSYKSSTDSGAGLEKYAIKRNGETITVATRDNLEKGLTFVLDFVLPEKEYGYTVKAIDKLGNETSEVSAGLAATTPMVVTGQKEGATKIKLPTSIIGEGKLEISEVKATPSQLVGEKTMAVVTWKTTVPSTSQVAYGQSQNYTNKTSLDSSLNSSHTVILTDLLPKTTYHYQVISKDKYGREVMSSDQTFVTSDKTQEKFLWEVVTESLVKTFRQIWDLMRGFLAAEVPSALAAELPTPKALSVVDVSTATTPQYLLFWPKDKGKMTVERQEEGKGWKQITKTDSFFYLDTDIKKGAVYSYKAAGFIGALKEELEGKPTIVEVKITGGAVKEDEASVIVTWKTDKLATSQVLYGETTVYTLKTELDSSLNQSHTVLIEKLKPETAYHFQVQSQDKTGKELTSSSDQTFTTSAPAAKPSVFEIIVKALSQAFSVFSNWLQK